MTAVNPEHAEIMGIQIRNMAPLEGKEEPIYKGDLYMDGVKIGSFEEDEDGGPTGVYVDSSMTDSLKDRIDRYFKSQDLTVEEEEDYDLFFIRLIELEELLHLFLDMRKRGPAYLVADYTDDEMMVYEVENDEGLQELADSEGLEDYDVYGSLEDFILN